MTRSIFTSVKLPIGTTSPAQRRRNGLTLTEVMIAIAITLILLGVLIQMFRYASGEISKGRAVIEMSGQLRMTSERLQTDLQGLTVPTRPWTSTADGQGYFEYYEGNQQRDDPTSSDQTIGDVDDILMFTARSKDRPFRGRYWVPGSTVPTIVESEWAEVVWWTVLIDSNGNARQDTGEQLLLQRRVLLIRPDLNVAATSIQGTNDLKTFYENNDISVRVTPNGLSANSLSDLSRRENRFAHFLGYSFPPAAGDPPTGPSIVTAVNASFPNPIDRSWLNGLKLTNNYEGEDVALSSIVEFNVKIFDPRAPIYDDRITSRLGPNAVGHVALTPSDPGYVNELRADLQDGVINSAIGYGAYVDLGYENVYVDRGTPGPSIIPGMTDDTINSHFSGFPIFVSSLRLFTTRPPFSAVPYFAQNPESHYVYSTWPTSYESDGINQNVAFNSIVDEGTNGVDDDGLNGPDDTIERETSPPYPFPVRGIQIVIRILEPDTQQIRQVTLVQDFIPE